MYYTVLHQPLYTHKFPRQISHTWITQMPVLFPAFLPGRTAFWMADFVGVGSADEDGLDGCVVHTAAEMGSSSVELMHGSRNGFF